jgi:hypothetical protein
MLILVVFCAVDSEALRQCRIGGHFRFPDQAKNQADEERLKEPLRSEMVPFVRYFFVTLARFPASVIGDLPWVTRILR